MVRSLLIAGAGQFEELTSQVNIQMCPFQFPEHEVERSSRLMTKMSHVVILHFFS